MLKLYKIAFIFVSILFSVINARAQKLVYIGLDHMSKGVKEAFYVLRDNPKIKQGQYALLRQKNYVPIYKGFYKNNQKDSLWREYDIKEHVIAEGYYIAGIKTGIWNYYSNQVLTNKYDFTKNQLVYHMLTNADTVQTYKIIQGTDTLYSRVNQAPIMLGDMPGLTNKFIDLFKDPHAIIFDDVDGQIIVAFTVDEQGCLSDFRVLNSLKRVNNNDVLALVKQVEMQWIPAMVNGQPVKSICKIPIRLF